MTKQRKWLQVDAGVNARREKLDELKQWARIDQDSHLLDWLIELGRQEMKRGAGMMRTTDRVQQVNWLRELAENVATNLGTGSAEELVTYALSEEGRGQWQIELPAWFDGHDQDLLVQYVEEAVR